MKRVQAERLVRKYTKGLTRDLFLKEWEIDIGVAKLDDDAKGASGVMPEYKSSSITIDHTRADDEDDLYRTVRHELVHVMISPFEKYRNQIRFAVSSAGVWRVLEECYRTCMEETVVNIEKVLDEFIGRSP